MRDDAQIMIIMAFVTALLIVTFSTTVNTMHIYQSRVAEDQFDGYYRMVRKNVCEEVKRAMLSGDESYVSSVVSTLNTEIQKASLRHGIWSTFYITTITSDNGTVTFVRMMLKMSDDVHHYEEVLEVRR